ncbi:MAG TPA: sigma 54 modulation/S30EA ribosomal C-terminal domain-containing protein, partial [Clostridiales bacterium]|nr:sigma 54 modulation/S30EA ribosomal C-terminal domain-containing protein [Clostridiales bacterium]
FKAAGLEDLNGGDSAEVQEELDFNIVRTKTVPLKPQTVDEAILQMNMLGHQFYMFLNAETDKISVVYVRHDGGYGMLEPELI